MSLFNFPLPTGRASVPPWTADPGVNLVILSLWLWLYQPVYGYLAIIFSREDFRTNQIVLVGVFSLILWQIRQGDLRPCFSVLPHLYYPALTLALGGSLLFLAVERFLDVNTLSASLFGLASYGLLGLWLEPHRWRRGLAAALLLIGALPFGEHMQTFIGYPLRLLTASLVRDGLAAAGVASLGVDTILVFENGVSQVDLPCSGVKSLWSGMLFLLAATWLERRSLNLRWLGVALVFVLLLLLTNFLRVGVLVTVGQVASWPLAAEMLHIPLGVIGFGAACAGALLMLRRLPGITILENSATLNGQGRPLWLSPLLALIFLLMIASYSSRPQIGLTQAPPAWSFPAALVTKPLPLKPDEIEWLTRDGAESAERYRFEWRGLSGTMILITSNTWRAHHRPERCFEVYGLSLDASQTYLVTPTFPLRWVSLGGGTGPRQLADAPILPTLSVGAVGTQATQAARTMSAAYWFQSPEQTTDDYGTRIWADLAVQRQRWVLVSILFDETPEPNTPEVQTLVLGLHQAVAQALGAPLQAASK